MMEEKIELTSEISNFQFDSKVVNKYDANDKLIAFSTDTNKINIYSMVSKNKLWFYHFESIINHFQFHPRFVNVLSVSLKKPIIYLYHIDIDKGKVEEKVKYLGCSDDWILKTLFSPYEDGAYLATLCLTDIKIWNMNRHYNDFNINLDDNISLQANRKMKWSESGQYLIFIKNDSKIEIFSLEKKEILYHLDIEDEFNDMFFLEKEEQLLIVEEEFIFVYNILNNTEIYKIKYDKRLIIKNSKFDYINNLIYAIDDKNIYIFSLEENKKIFETKINRKSIFYILGNINDDPKLFSKLILYSNKNQFEVLSIYSKNTNLQKFKEIEEAEENFWENSLKNIYNNFDFLSYTFNEINEEEKNIKKYLYVDEISKEEDYLLKNKTLEEKRQIVANNMKNFKEDKNIDIAFINYIKNLIKDNTNTSLLINYLPFLKENKLVLNEKYTDQFEAYEDEINNYQVCLTKEILKEKFDFIKDKSEEEKLEELLKEIIKIQDIDKFKNYINKEYNKLKNIIFNQPITFSNKELYFFRNRIIILFDIKRGMEFENDDTIKDMKYCINEVLKRDLFKKNNIINNEMFLTLIIILIVVPQIQILTDYNLNLIDEDDIEVNENKLKDLGFIYNSNKNGYENKKDNTLVISKNEMYLYNFKNLKLYMNTEHKGLFKAYELYKYDYLKKHHSKLFNEDYVRKFISKILVSKVFKEAFSFFYGCDIKYPFSDDDFIKEEGKAKNYVNKYINIVPFKFQGTSGITDKFTMQTFIFLNAQIANNLSDDKRILSESDKLIVEALLNGAIVAINAHEINHNFHNYYYFSKNGRESQKTPRKKGRNERESGNNMERILFGRTINNLSLRQVLFILNQDNYNKSLSQFRIDFSILKDEDCKCKGIFENYSNIDMAILNLSDYLYIEFKSIYYIKHVSIKLNNDVIGFPNFYKSIDTYIDSL